MELFRAPHTLFQMAVDLRRALSDELVAEVRVQQSQKLLAVRISNLNGSHAGLVSRRAS